MLTGKEVSSDHDNHDDTHKIKDPHPIENQIKPKGKWIWKRKLNKINEKWRKFCEISSRFKSERKKIL